MARCFLVRLNHREYTAQIIFTSGPGEHGRIDHRHDAMFAMGACISVWPAGQKDLSPLEWTFQSALGDPVLFATAVLQQDGLSRHRDVRS